MSDAVFFEMASGASGISVRQMALFCLKALCRREAEFVVDSLLRTYSSASTYIRAWTHRKVDTPAHGHAHIYAHACTLRQVHTHARAHKHTRNKVAVKKKKKQQGGIASIMSFMAPFFAPLSAATPFRPTFTSHFLTAVI